MQKILFGLHIPKCAGSSLLRMMMSRMRVRQVYQCTSLHRNFVEFRPSFFDLYDKPSLKLVWGHWLHEEMLRALPKTYIFTGLREPKDRLISEYKFNTRLMKQQGRVPMSPSEWLEGQDNPICHFLIERFPQLADASNSSLSLSQKAIRVLECFDHVYFTDNYEESANHIAEILGIKAMILHDNASDQEEPVTLDLKRDQLIFDQELFEWAKKAFGSNPPKSRPECHKRLANFLQKPADLQKLQHFIHQAEAEELMNYGILDREVGYIDKAIERLQIQKQHLLDYRHR